MKLSQQSLSIIESAIQKAVAKYVCSCEQTVVTDIHLQPDQASGQLNIYNDDCEIDKYCRKTGIWPVAQKFREHLDNHYKGILDVRTY
jgi:hypothetical protein